MPETVINYQSPYTAQSLLDHIGTATPTTAVCWKLRPDPASPLYASGLEVRATSHDRKLVLPGHGSGQFLPGVAGLPSAIDTESGHESAGLQYETVFSSAGITREDVVAVTRSLKGVPFRHQGSNPETGIDCRGVIEYIALVLRGRPIPARDYQRTPSGAEFLEKMRAEMVEIDPQDARHGDAVLMHFPKDTEARHGGILALGPYEMMIVHAWESRGEGAVREEPLRGWKLRNIDYAFHFPFIGD